jgi:hypothetical protein
MRAGYFIFLIFLISGAYFPKFWVNFQNVKTKTCAYLWLEIEPGFVGMPGFG